MTNVVQLQRLGVEPLAECEAIGRLDTAPAVPVVLLNPPGPPRRTPTSRRSPWCAFAKGLQRHADGVPGSGLRCTAGVRALAENSGAPGRELRGCLLGEQLTSADVRIADQDSGGIHTSSTASSASGEHAAVVRRPAVAGCNRRVRSRSHAATPWRQAGDCSPRIRSS